MKQSTTTQEKSNWESDAVFIILLISGFPHKRVHPFSILILVTPSFPRPLTMLNLEKIWVQASSVVCGLRAGLRMFELKKASKCKFDPRPLPMIVDRDLFQTNAQSIYTRCFLLTEDA